MFETLESRRMMSVSTTTTSQPPPSPTTTSSIDMDDLKQASQMFGFLQSAVTDVIKSMGDALNNPALKA